QLRLGVRSHLCPWPPLRRCRPGPHQSQNRRWPSPASAKPSSALLPSLSTSTSTPSAPPPGAPPSAPPSLLYHSLPPALRNETSSLSEVTPMRYIFECRLSAPLHYS